MNTLTALFCLVSCSAQASQIQVMDEERELTVLMSISELNRILVEQDRISDVFTHSSSLQVLPDERLGQIFIKVNQPPKKGVRLTLTTEEGRIQDLRLQGQEISGQTLILKERHEPYAELKQYDERIEMAHILSEFLLGQAPEGFSLLEQYETTQTYKSSSYVVESFKYMNTLEVPITLEERLFADSAQAVLIDCPYLESGESTQAWRILRND